MKIKTILLLTTLSFSTLAAELPSPDSDLGDLRIGIITNNKVTAIRIDHLGKGFATFTNTLGGSRPSCVDTTTNNGEYAKSLSFDTNTDAGRSIYSMVLTAKSTGQSITAYGTGACQNYNVIESWKYGYLIN